MLDPAVVESFLVAGITGAGLVLTAYTLAIERSRRLLSNRAEEWLAAIRRVGDAFTRYEDNAGQKEVDELFD
jgi:hypothetical protein